MANDSNPSTLTVLLTTILILGGLLLAGYFYFNPSAEQTSSNTSLSPNNKAPAPKDPEEEKKAIQIAFIENFMQEQSKGRNVDKFFCFPGGVLNSTFYAPRKWEIVDSYSLGFILRVDSSNKGGMPITGLYDIMMATKDGKPCVNFVNEKK